MKTTPSSPISDIPLMRVVVFMTRERDGIRELLVVRSASGVFLPEDMVEEREQPQEAILRLVHNSVHVHDIDLPRLLQTLNEQLPNSQRLALQAQILRTVPNPDASLMRFTLRRGMQVQAVSVEGDFTRVVYEEYALQEDELAITTRRAGWVYSSGLTHTVLRHLYLVPTREKRHQWQTKTSDGETLDFYWTPLDRNPGLMHDHDAWLGHVYEQLLR